MSGHQPRLAAAELTAGDSVGGPLEQAMGEFANAVVRANTLDPLTTEIVRLRCAQIHDCRICGSLRLRDAQEAGFDEAMQRKIARYETSDFPPAVIAALRLCDAIIMRPAWADDALKAELHQHFSAAQIAEICLDVMKWSQQKPLVALRTEEPPWAQTTLLSFDERGAPVFGGPA
ncbi:carboxymuconolactone decarboxylase family protein [Mangrovimicrobium sediminis]|uniref:carboxymuconolactone decarboxylase family protein n=1 Tax=Mangrovimicrobium sediminis TaxID=2562682 RepID=UPI001436A431|nr:carboxymuconolactone decarboxylase family protein [Haliea sp. SAOS-164]